MFWCLNLWVLFQLAPQLLIPLGSEKKADQGSKIPTHLFSCSCTNFSGTQPIVLSFFFAQERRSPLSLERALQVPSYLNCCLLKSAFRSRKQQLYWWQNMGTKNHFLLIAETGSWKLVVSWCWNNLMPHVMFPTSSLHLRLWPAYIPRRLPLSICHGFSISWSPFNGIAEGFTAVIGNPPFLWICSVYLGRSQAIGSPKKSHLYFCGQWCRVAGCVHTSSSSHTVTITQHSTYHNMTVILINKVSLDSSYCDISGFCLGGTRSQSCLYERNGPSWSTEHCGNLKRFRLSDQTWDIWCGIFKVFNLQLVAHWGL